MKRQPNIKKSLVMAKNGKGAAIPLDIRLYDAVMAKFEAIEKMCPSCKPKNKGKGIPRS